MLRYLILIPAWCAALIGAAGLFGALHPALDSLALLRPVCAGLAALGCCVAFGATRMILAAAALTSAAFTFAAIPVNNSEGEIRIYSKNLLWHNDQIAPIIADIRQSDADLVMLQEVARANAQILEQLADRFPYQHVCNSNRRLSVALLSKHPFKDLLPCSPRNAAGARLSHNGTDLWAVSVHVHWHWPVRSRPGEIRLTTALRSLDGPVIVAGDFNSFLWTRRMHDLRTATGTRAAGPPAGTYRHRALPLRLPIDHALSPGGGRLDRRPRFGSDHYGLVADLSLAR